VTNMRSFLVALMSTWALGVGALVWGLLGWGCLPFGRRASLLCPSALCARSRWGWRRQGSAESDAEGRRAGECWADVGSPLDGREG
jgi:hypothetical protein